MGFVMVQLYAVATSPLYYRLLVIVHLALLAGILSLFCCDGVYT